MDYAESLDDAALAAFVTSWIDANPLGAPGAVRFAWRPYNLSLRVAAWARELARRGGRLPPTVQERMAASLAAQLRFLAGHLETDLRGNHLIKNLRGLLWGSAVFAGPEAEGWRDPAAGFWHASWTSRSWPTAATMSARRPTSVRCWRT